MAIEQCAYSQELTVNEGVYTLRITPRRGSESFSPVNTNGSQRGWRPIVAFLPHRVESVRLVAGDWMKPTITDDFILIPNPRDYVPGKDYRVIFRAKKL